jgi:hypothetical protein
MLETGAPEEQLELAALTAQYTSAADAAAAAARTKPPVAGCVAAAIQRTLAGLQSTITVAKSLMGELEQRGLAEAFWAGLYFMFLHLLQTIMYVYMHML